MKTALVVDDEYAIAETLADLLGAEGFRTVICRDGALAAAVSAEEIAALLDERCALLAGARAARLYRLREGALERVAARPGEPDGESDPAPGPDSGRDPGPEPRLLDAATRRCAP